METQFAPEAGRSSVRALVLELWDAFADEHAVQVRQVELIDRLCRVYSVVDVSGPAIPGQERLVPAGADGTPHVAEQLATEVAAKLHLPIEAVGGLMAESMNLVWRHPRLWQATRAGRVRVWQGRLLAAQVAAAGLSAEAAGWVDEQLEPALGRVPWGRVKRRLAGLILRADTELAARKAAAAQAERFVRVRLLGDGTAVVTARADAVDVLRFSRTLDQLAGHLALAGETDEHDVLRASALGVLADPDTAVALLAGPDSEPAAGGDAGNRSGARGDGAADAPGTSPRPGAAPAGPGGPPSWWCTSPPASGWAAVRSWVRCWPSR